MTSGRLNLVMSHDGRSIHIQDTHPDHHPDQLEHHRPMVTRQATRHPVYTDDYCERSMMAIHKCNVG
jgi:hypothetical protein